MSKKAIEYRSDIDGLRALAILPVVLFHAGVTGFAGGYIGVDIFFVISGFLITSIILKEIEAGTFSLLHFWERRIRRIVPVLFFILCSVTIVAYFLVLYPVDFISYGQALFAQSIFIANIFFMRQYDYFAGPAEAMPLLHTWSLSVEEQFYLLLPLLLVTLIFISRRLIVPVLAGLLLVSFAYSFFLVNLNPLESFQFFISGIWGGATNTTAGFYFLPARAWELLTGSLLACGIIVIRNNILSEFLSVLGLLLIIFSVIYTDVTKPFPGVWALLPVIGTGLIISANTHSDTFTKRLLSFPAFVSVGLISYSLYLWHWPLIVFAKIIFTQFTQIVLLGTLAFTFVLSILTYRYIEQPFRRSNILKKTWQVYLAGIGALVVMFSIGFYIHVSAGLPERSPDTLQAIAAAAVDVNPRQYECFKKNYREILDEPKPCLLGAQVSLEDVSFVMWGDSHSDALMPAVDEMLLERGKTGAYFGTGGCVPIFLIEPISEDPKCERVKSDAIDYINENKIKTVMLVGDWKSNQGLLSISNMKTLENIGYRDITFLEAVQSTLNLFEHNPDVYVIARVPAFDNFSIRKIFQEYKSEDLSVELPSKSLLQHRTDTQYEFTAFQVLEKGDWITLIDPADVLCRQDNVCSMQLEGQIIYSNGTHINASGASVLKNLLYVIE